MKNQKPLSERQKRVLGSAIEALTSPIFSTNGNKQALRYHLRACLIL